MFDQAILAAGDCQYDTFDQPKLTRLTGLDLLASRVSMYYSHVDHVLQLSMAVNLGAQRLVKMALAIARTLRSFRIPRIQWSTARLTRITSSTSSLRISIIGNLRACAGSSLSPYEASGFRLLPILFVDLRLDELYQLHGGAAHPSQHCPDRGRGSHDRGVPAAHPAASASICTRSKRGWSCGRGCGDGSATTIPLHHTHLAMSLMRRGFAVCTLVPRGLWRVALHAR